MIQTSRGQIVAPMQTMLDRNRHVTLTCVSADDGKTWQRGNIIDLGGRGDHDGAMEATVAELSNGRLLMLIRTNLDRFWEAYSDDGGRYWREIRPSPDRRLQFARLPDSSGQRPAGAGLESTVSRREEAASCRAAAPIARNGQASWQREELSLAFSEDDAKTWTKPVVIARQPGGGLSYPFVFERRPGELWIITRYPTKVSFSLKEADFVQK